MKLKKLLKEIAPLDVRGSKDVEITGVTANSQLVGPGSLFVARKGQRTDGGRYIPEAVLAGCAAVLSDIYDPFLKDVTQLVTDDVTEAEKEIAAAYYRHPSRELYTVGVTGTNGKTTTAYLVKHLLDSMEMPCGLIGTIEYVVGGHSYRAMHTTPDICTNQKLLREMVAAGCRAAVMEVSSHALQQGRVDGLEYDAALFTNLTPEHLDYHHTMDEYGKAKARLFDKLPAEGVAVVNRDDPHYMTMVQNTQAKIITYGLDSRADLFADDVVFSSGETEMTVRYRDQSAAMRLPLAGRYNLSNCLAALGALLQRGYTLDQLASGVAAMPRVPGRLELVPNARGLRVFVDYAHTEDSLNSVLKSIREWCPARLITVFGCGGDRDRFKRPLMAKSAERHSDLCIVTSDNPRSEDPLMIIDEIVQGFETKKYVIEPDRQKAIEKAVAEAHDEDVLLIAGKGHETYQIFRHHTIDFDDRQVVKQALDALKAVG